MMTFTGELEKWDRGEFVPAYKRLIFIRLEEAREALGARATDKRIMEYALKAYTDDMGGDPDLARQRWDGNAELCLRDLETCDLRPWKKRDDKRETKSEGDTPGGDAQPERDGVETAITYTMEPPKDEAIMTATGRRAVKPLLVSADELDKQHLKPVEWIVDGMIPVGLTVLGAPPKSYKSYMMLDLCAAVADGQPFLGRKTSKHAALYLDLESTQRRPQARLRQILGDDTPKPAQLYISTSDSGWARVGEGFEEQLADVVRENPAIRLVVVDVLSYVRPEGNARAKEYDRDYMAMMPLKKLADKLDIAIICVTHTTKMVHADDAFCNITGSQAVTGACDSQMVICKKRGEDEGRLVVTGRDAEYMDMAVKFDQTRMRWQYLGTTEDREYQQQQREYEQSDVVTAIIVALRDKDRWEGTADDLITTSGILSGYDTRTVGRHIAKFEGLLQSLDRITHEMNIVCVGGQTQRRHVFARMK